MSRKTISFTGCWVVLLVCASLSPADAQAHPKPLGVYAHVDIEYALQGCKPKPCGPDQQLSYLSGLYTDLLGNVAISGLAVGIHWDVIQLSSPRCSVYHTCVPGTDPYGNSWIFLDGVFAAVAAANAKANGAPKSVQLIITPGVDSPSWLLRPSTYWWCPILGPVPCPPLANSPPLSCDGLFTGAGTAPADCGKVTFAQLPEQQRADPKGGPWQLPLPWNSAYQMYWGEFLTEVNAKYGGNLAFVSIAVAGPNGASTEMVLPTTANGSKQQPGVKADRAWREIIAHDFRPDTGYRDTDEVFIDNWTQTIKEYERAFPNVTLVISPNTGEDLPAFARNTTTPVHSDNKLVAEDCSTYSQDDPGSGYRSCEAKTEILSRFLTLGDNAKATQVGGMRASSPTCKGDIGLPGVKLLTAGSSLASPPLIGGAAFDHAVSGPGQAGKKLRYDEGCPPKKPEPPATCTTTTAPAPNCNVSIGEAAYNVLTNFFYGTSYAPDFGGPSPIGTPATIQYVQVEFEDVQYANENPPPNSPSTIPCKSSLQYLLDIASYDLFTMASQTPPVQKPNCTSP
ncbi:MAG: hypothetical protein WBS19_07510 [Candidatus Korobacteraceae bacterium]